MCSGIVLFVIVVVSAGLGWGFVSIPGMPLNGALLAIAVGAGLAFFGVAGGGDQAAGEQALQACGDSVPLWGGIAFAAGIGAALFSKDRG